MRVLTTRAALRGPSSPARSYDLLAVARQGYRRGGTRPVPDLFDVLLVTVHPALDDDIDEPPQQTADIAAGKLSATLALLHQKHQLLERQCGARGVHARDGPR